MLLMVFTLFLWTGPGQTLDLSQKDVTTGEPDPTTEWGVQVAGAQGHKGSRDQSTPQ